MVKLYKGDAIERMKEIESGSIDLVLVDPPYETTSCPWDTAFNFDAWWSEIRRVRKPSAPTVVTAQHPFTCVIGGSNIKELQYSWVWEKTRATGHLNAKKRPMKQHEDVLVFYAKQPKYHPQGLVHDPKKVMNSASHSRRSKTNPTSTVSGGIRHEEYTQEYTNYPRSIIKIASEGGTVHPTQKPVALMEYLIQTYTDKGDVVMDCFMGSGTTGVAAGACLRSFVGIERDDHYYEVAKKRIWDTGRDTVLEF